MKKILLLLFLLFMAQRVVAQNFIPMLDEENEWSVVSIDFFDGSQSSTLYTVQGEEIINGVTYKVIQGGNTSGCTLREENGVVYYIDGCTNTEAIMLDFNLEVGDTFYVGSGICNSCAFSFWNFPFDELEVIASTVEFIAGQERKVLEFRELSGSVDPVHTEFWIEGIGSTVAIAPASTGIDGGKLLICFTREGETTFFNEYTECVFELGTETFESNTFILSPNPITGTSTLKLSNPGIANRLKIYDMAGKFILEKNVTLGQAVINAEELSSGLYFYHLLSNENIVISNQFIID